MALHPDVLAELEAERAARGRKDAELPLSHRVNALEAPIGAMRGSASERCRRRHLGGAPKIPRGDLPRIHRCSDQAADWPR